MVKLKLYGIFSLLIFCIPLFFSFTPERDTTVRPKTKKIAVIPKVEIPSPKTTVVVPPKPIRVTASVYFPEVAQTDDTPYMTADGSRINKKKPGKHRWVAVSRNLLRKWGGKIDYGDTLKVKGISKKMDGYYVVRDTMTPRLKNRIDILVSEGDGLGFWRNINIYHLN